MQNFANYDEEREEVRCLATRIDPAPAFVEDQLRRWDREQAAAASHGSATPQPDGGLTQPRRGMRECICEHAQCRANRWPVIDPSLLPPATTPSASVEAASRLGFEPFDYTERS